MVGVPTPATPTTAHVSRIATARTMQGTGEEDPCRRKMSTGAPRQTETSRRRRKRAGVKKYARLVKQLPMKGLRNRRLRQSLHKATEEAGHSAAHAARAELVYHQEHTGYVKAEGMERTYHLRQEELAESVPIAASMSYFDLSLTQLGPYTIDYSRNGRHLLLGGRKGHLASIDWRERRIASEVQVEETVRDVSYLHNETMLAVAQKHNLYIYDNRGVELHRVKELGKVNVMTFLPYHFLLATAGGFGDLGYLDVSTGRVIAQHRTHMGDLRVMAHNPHNAAVHLGHHNGTVTLWTPNMNKPVVKMLCHRAPLTALSVDTSGRYMVTAGMDAQLKVWDCRQYLPMHSFHSRQPAASLSISQCGLVALGHGRVCEVWRDTLTSSEWCGPYLTHRVAGEIQTLQFCPFEDVLGVGHSNGFSSMIVPGAGEPNFDALEVNPFQTKRQRQEAEVISLLEKIPADLITVDPHQLTALDDADQQTLEKEKLEAKANAVMRKKKRLKQRGRSKPHKLLARKQQLRAEAAKQQKRERERTVAVTAASAEVVKPVTKKYPSVLDRFK